MGDSITWGVGDPNYGSYRAPLLPLLHQSGYDVDFVGSIRSGSLAGDPDNEGHRANTISQVYATIVQNQVVRKSTPDAVLIHLGTNDMVNQSQAEAAPNNMRVLIGEILSQQPSTRIFLASIIPSLDEARKNRVVPFNMALTSLAQDLSQRYALTFVDMFDSIQPIVGQDLADFLHPTVQGYTKMALTWQRSLQSIYTSSGRTILNGNPHFQGLITLPARGNTTNAVPFWNNGGISIARADATGDLNAVAPLTGAPGMSTPFKVNPGQLVTVFYRAKNSQNMQYCTEPTSNVLKVTSLSDPTGMTIFTTPTDTWTNYNYTFTATFSSEQLTLKAPGSGSGCGPMVADVLVTV